MLVTTRPPLPIVRAVVTLSALHLAHAHDLAHGAIAPVVRGIADDLCQRLLRILHFVPPFAPSGADVILRGPRARSPHRPGRARAGSRVDSRPTAAKRAPLRR